MTILQRLSQWQKSQAQKEGLEGYMVVSFATLKLIAAQMPQSVDDLLSIKGMGPRKVEKYGEEILKICSGVVPAISQNETVFGESQLINEVLEDTVTKTVETDEIAFGVMDDEAHPLEDALRSVDKNTGEILLEQDQQSLGVGEFLQQLNQILGSYFSSVRIEGEVIGFKSNRNGHVYFELKDVHGVMRCSVFKQYYEASGVALQDGMQIIITGKPSHHANYGFSFIGTFVELSGEGALKKAYDDLKKKIQGSGLMDHDRKRTVADMPRRIGLITSPTGAAIGDFTTNIGNYGYTILFHPARVEGAQSACDLLKALDVLATKELDVLVITRGGGSLESLQAFNNEKVVRAIADFPVPVIAGIGHEQDETISTLVADIGVSTPTAAARTVRESYDGIDARLDRCERVIIGSFSQSLNAHTQRREQAQHLLERSLYLFIKRPTEIIQSFEYCVEKFSRALVNADSKLTTYQKLFDQYDPRKKLAQGYSIARDSTGHIVRSVAETRHDQKLILQVEDGFIDTRVKQIKE